MAKRIRLKFGMECVLPRGTFQKKLCSSVQALSSYRCVKTAFTWFLYNTHLSVARPTWPHDPLSCVLIARLLFNLQNHNTTSYFTVLSMIRAAKRIEGPEAIKNVEPLYSIYCSLYVRHPNPGGLGAYPHRLLDPEIKYKSNESSPYLSWYRTRSTVKNNKKY